MEAFVTKNIDHIFSYFLIVSWLGLIASATFVVLYGIVVNQLTATGRHMLVFSFFIAGIFLDQIAVLMWHWGEQPAHIITLMILFTAVALGMWHRLLLFFREQVTFNFKSFRKQKRRVPVKVHNTQEEEDNGDTY